MAPYSILSIGCHPNIAFYNWRLNASNSVDLSLVESTDLSDASYQPNGLPNQTFYSWSSEQFGNERYSLNNVFKTLDDYILHAKNNHLDFIFLSAISLQSLSTICSSLNQIIKYQLDKHNVPTIIVESTNFVNLEPFVKMSLQLNENDAELVPIISIMSDFDVREVGNKNFLLYKSKKESELVYVGKSGRENSYTSIEIGLINKIADLFESAKIDVYKLNTPLEFLSYQWKFALPKITVEPLSIIFENPFPSDLQRQILAKPLISGLIFEIITVIKTMGCKLFNSYDNEDSLLLRLSQLYPPVKLSDDASEAPKLYYDFFNQNQLYLDLLLLQPILIADDFQVKTPYLEFLYAVMSKYNTNNFSTLDNETSIFWLRKNSENVRQLKLKQDELVLENSLREKKIAQNHQLLSNPSPPSTSASNINNQAIPQNRLSNTPPRAQYQQKTLNRSSTDPQIDPEMEELSDMVQSYGVINQTPNSSSRRQSVGNLQPPFTKSHQQDAPSPNLVPQQSLPHGLPPQGLPPNQQLFNQLPNQQPQGRKSYYGGPPPQQQQQQMNNYPPMHQHQQYSQQFQPANPYSSRDDVSYMSRTSHMNGPGGMNGMGGMNAMNGMGGMGGMGSMNGMNGMNNFDTPFNSMGSANAVPTMGNRQFKPTSRKSSRKSTAIMANQLVNEYPGMTQSRSNSNMLQLNRMSMNPQGNMRGNASSQNLRQMPSNSNFKKPQGMSQAPSQFGAEASLSPPPMNGSGSDGPSNGSSGSLPKQAPVDLVPVPEATPAPTPAYIPQSKENDEKKKKKRGFLGIGKKKS